MSRAYRPDIDGLRAIAVLSVVLYHINPAWVPGGYVGVDIFFVISGYLITGNILRDHSSVSGFSWSEFYRKRALRILPVLFLVIFVCLIVGQLILLPKDLEEMSWSALAGVFSVPNIYFNYFLDTSYFADDSSHKPLLHLWSLGVEEQFYFFWPVILIFLLYKFSYKHVFVVAFVLLFASFVFAENVLKTNQMFSYYMLPARAGELLIGALLAIGLARTKVTFNMYIRFAIGFIGIGLVVYSLTWFDENTAFPGFNAFPSTIGAALLILAGSTGGGMITKMLSLKPMVLVGLISYSLYLWHWPILAFYRYMYVDISVPATVVLLFLMFLFSFISYRAVEKPFRQLKFNFKEVIQKPVAAGVIVLVVLCSGFIVTKGFGFYEFDEDYKNRLRSFSPALPAYSYSYVCQKGLLTTRDTSWPDCIINGNSEPGVLLWGDSNAAHYIGILGAFSEEAGFSFRNVAHSSCPPMLRGAELTVKADQVEHCLSSIEQVKQILPGYKMIILGGSWDFYASKDSKFYDLLADTLKELVDSGKRVVILGVIPRAKNIDRSCEQKGLKILVPACDFEEGAIIADDVNNKLKELALKNKDVFYYDVVDDLCPAGICQLTINDQLLYYDRGHFSMNGSWLIGKNIIKKSGVPSVFNELNQYSYESFGLTDFDMDWKELLIDAISPRRWRGTELKNDITDGLLMKDSDENNYESSIFDLPLSSLEENNYFKFAFSDCRGGFPLFRLREKVVGVIHQYDAQVDCETGTIANLGDLNRNDAALKTLGDGSYELILRYKKNKNVDNFSVIVFPAVGSTLWQYNKSATGSILLKNISIAK